MRGLWLGRARPFQTLCAPWSRVMSTTSWLSKKNDQLPPRPNLPDDELQHTFLKGSGPGGQKIVRVGTHVHIERC